jgi:NitT/TauT family transport system substrate-binding protein
MATNISRRQIFARRLAKRQHSKRQLSKRQLSKRQLSKRQLLAGGAAVALAGVLPNRPARAALGPLNFGYMITTWGAVGMVAEELKLFDKHGVAVNIFKFESGTAVRDALVAGRIDIGVTSTSSFIIAADKRELAAIATVAYSGASNSVMVRSAAADIKEVADLRGRKVATQFGAGADYTFQNQFLPKFGVKASELQLVNVKFADHIAAVASGSVDAFVGTEPFPSVAEHNKIARTLATFEKYDIVPVILSMNQRVLGEKTDAAVAFMKGWLEAVDIFRNDPARAANVVWKVFTSRGYKLPESVIAAAVGKLGVNPDYIPELEPYLTEQASILVKERKIAAVPDWKEWLNRAVIQKARQS